MSAYTYKGVLHPSMESVVAEIVREMAIPIDQRPAHEVFDDGIEAVNGDGSREWIAEYMLESPPPKTPGIYCATCGHSEPMYWDRMVPGHKGEGMPCCDRKDCGCIAHLIAWFMVDPPYTPDPCSSCNESIGISATTCAACAAWFRAVKEGYCTVDLLPRPQHREENGRYDLDGPP